MGQENGPESEIYGHAAISRVSVAGDPRRRFLQFGFHSSIGKYKTAQAPDREFLRRPPENFGFPIYFNRVLLLRVRSTSPKA